MKFPSLSATLKLLKRHKSADQVKHQNDDMPLTLYDKIEEIINIANYDNRSMKIVVRFYELTEIQQQLTLITLIEHNMGETIEVILKSGFDVNYLIRGRTPLHYAVHHQHLHIMRMLVNYQADLEGKDIYKETALNAAVRTGHFEAIEYLLKQGSQVNTEASDSTTPLEFAINNGDMASVDILKQYGANLGSSYLVKNV